MLCNYYRIVYKPTHIHPSACIAGIVYNPNIFCSICLISIHIRYNNHKKQFKLLTNYFSLFLDFLPGDPPDRNRRRYDEAEEDEDNCGSRKR